MLIDLLRKPPLQLFLGLMIFVRGSMVIWFNVGEVFLTNDVYFIKILLVHSWNFKKT